MNIILLMSDTLRYDFLGCNGNGWIDTRDLDAFAKKCVVFDNCHTGSFPTIPQRTDMATGRFIFPFAGWQPLMPGWKPIAEYLHEAGYVTQLICDTPHLVGHGCNFFRGFDGYYWERGQEGDTPFTRMNTPLKPVMPHEKTRCDYKVARKPPHPLGIPRDVTLADRHAWTNAHRRGEEDRFMMKTARNTVRWLEENHACEKFFLWVDMFDPHEPWDPPEYLVKRYDPDYTGTPMIHPNYGHASAYTPAELKNLRAHYAGEVHLVSKAVGIILRKIEEVGLMDDTAILFTADHGHMIGEHDMVGKSNIHPEDERVWAFYREVTHTPLMACVPGIKPRRISSMVQHVDMMPTMLEFAGLKAPDGIDGRPLGGILTGLESSVRPCAITAAAGAGDWDITKTLETTIQDKRYSLVISRTFGEAEHVWERRPAGPVRFELYDTKQDPGQQRSILRKNPREARRLLKYFSDFIGQKGKTVDVKLPG